MFEFLRSAASYIVAISVLVAFHEFGHFWAARRVGVRVLRFSVGFGRPLWRRVGRDGVEYVLASIPLGGYVKLLDEREGPVPEQDLPGAFNRKPAWARIFVFAAGPAFNFILAVIFMWATLVIGVPSLKPLLGQPPADSLAAAAGIRSGERVVSINNVPIQDWDRLHTEILADTLDRQSLQLVVQDADGSQHLVSLDTASVRLDPRFLMQDLGLVPFTPPIPPVVGAFAPGSAAQRAGMQVNDQIVTFNGQPVSSFGQLLNLVTPRAGQKVHLTVRRGTQSVELDVVLASEIEGHSVVGRLGVHPAHVANVEKLWQDLQLVVRLGPVAALPAAVQEMRRQTVLVAKLVYHMLLGDISVRNLSGPISTAEAAGFAASAGLSTFLYFIAFVSLNVGIVNLLPLPVLDGGQIVSSLIEWIKGSPLSDRTMIVMQQIGFALLILIMGFAFYNDLARTIG